MTTVEIPPIISVDDHVIEPPDLWQRWLPARFRDAGPKVVRGHYEVTARKWPPAMVNEGPMTDFWIYEDLKTCVPISMTAVGLAAESVVEAPNAFDEMRPGAWQMKARLEDMDTNWIERSLCFPTFPRFCGQTFLEAHDKELALACVQAYNDWMIDEWCGDSGGRLIPLCLIPLWDGELAAKEVLRNAERGARAVTFSELPASLGLPSIHDSERRWDPFFAACNDTETVVCIHVGSASKIADTSPDAPKAVSLASLSMFSQLALTDWLLSANFVRFPNLKLAMSESQIGWMPYLYGRVDAIWKKGNAQSGISPLLVDSPSSYAKGRVYGCFFEDDFGIKSRDDIGIDTITFESDYPHQDSTWPDTKAYAERAMAGLSQDEINKIVRDNAIRLFNLPQHI